MGVVPRPNDARALRVLEWLAGLAACLMGAQPDDTLSDVDEFGSAPVAEGFGSLADGLGLPVWVAGPAFEVIWVNSACEALFGVTPHDAGRVELP